MCPDSDGACCEAGPGSDVPLNGSRPQDLFQLSLRLCQVIFIFLLQNSLLNVYSISTGIPFRVPNRAGSFLACKLDR
jgi:hypothetical protein